MIKKIYSNKEVVMSQEIINIPPVVFQIVWPILYVGLLIFIILIGKQNSSDKRTIIQDLFWIGLLLNILWCIVYFYYRKILLSVFILCGMILIGLFILYYTRPTKNFNNKSIIFSFSIYTLYMLWLSFALYLLIVNNYKN
jgi:tryptophan-rich sensory protein